MRAPSAFGTAACARVAAVVACFTLGASGCGPGDVGPALTATPAHASLFGQVDVTWAGEVASLGAVQYVSVGGVAAYDWRPSANGLTVTLQGAEHEGAAGVLVVGANGRASHEHIFTYDAPAPGVPRSWVAFGASLTQGTQSGGIDAHTQIFGVAAQTARAAGVWLALPLFVDGVTPPLTPADFNPDCSQKPNTGAGTATLTAVLTDPSTGLFDLRRGRVDYSLAPRDLAVGGSKVADILDGASGTPALLEHLVSDPTADPGDVLDPVTVSQIAQLERLDPEVALSSDLLANDLDGSVVQGDDIHVELITDLNAVQPRLVEMMGRLGKLHGQYFIANLPSLTFIPNVFALRARRIAQGLDTAESFDAKTAMVDAATDAYDQALVAAMAPYPNLHLVDFKGQVDQIRNTGITVGGETLTVQKFDGLLSLDNLHFTDTGYALYANVFIDAINGVLKTTIAHVDLEAVHAQDALSPTALRAAGLTCVPPAM